MSTSNLHWEWETTDPGRPGMSGDLAKLFRHEQPKAPGVFGLNPPPAAATLLAREVIQNSWDAARDLQEHIATAPQFEMEFGFHALTGQAKADLVSALHLDELAGRVKEVDRGKVGLAKSDCLSALDSDAPLRVLKIRESAASGMYGPWMKNRSHMYLALLSIGFTEKFSGAGGSYGYGKAGLINGSRIRTIVAYSCFRANGEEPDVTRRLLGVTYWGAHDFHGNNHPGIGSFSAGHAGAIKPFENDAADEIAKQLGLDVRDPDHISDLGTTFLLIDTPIDPAELVDAIELSWWPALVESDFFVRVIDYDDSTIIPRPLKRPLLHPFIDAWELAMGRSNPGPQQKEVKLTGSKNSNVDSVGRLALVADLEGWSYADQAAHSIDEEVAHRSLVALTRSPRMVVEYLEAGRSPPYLRGVFIADDEIDDVLRRSEPKAHDAWQTRSGDGELDPEAAAVAAHVIQRIKTTVNNHRAKLKPPPPPPEDVNLPFFNEVMRKMTSGPGAGVPQPIPDTRPLSIRLNHAPRLAQGGQKIEVAGQATIGLSDHYEGDESDVTISLSYRFLEDDRMGSHAHLDISAPEGFQSHKPGVYTGVLRRGEDIQFEFVSDPYDSNWSGRLVVDGVVDSQSMSSGAEE